MKKLLASAAAVLIASPALAGALIFEPEPEPVVTVAPAPAPAPIANWTGPYAGVQVGWGDGEVDVDTDILDFTADDDGLVYGAQLGYDYDFGNGFVLGAEASYLQADIEPSATIAGVGTGEAEIEHVARLTARGGYSLGNTLLYVKGGATWMEVDFSADTGPDDSGSASDWGWVAGVGIEHLITDNISAGVEYLYHQVDDFDDADGWDLELQTVTARVNFRF